MKGSLYRLVLFPLFILVAVTNQFSQEIIIEEVSVFAEKEDDDNYIFWEPTGFDIDENGNVYILDTRNGRIQKFDDNGRYLNTIGQRGSGPGELKYPVSIRISDTKMFVYDPGNVRISTFTLEGKVIDSVTSGKYFNSIMFDYEGNLYSKDTWPISIGSSKPTVLAKYNSKGKFEFNMGEKVFWPMSATKKAKREGGSSTTYVSLFGSNILFTIDKNNNVHVTYPFNSSQITKYSSSGTELLKIDHKMERLEVVEEDKEFLYEKFSGYNIVGIPKHKPFIKFINTDDNNNIWITTYDGDINGEIHFHVFSEEGQFLYSTIITAKNPRTVRQIRIKKDNIYVFFYSQENGAKLIKYRIKE